MNFNWRIYRSTLLLSIFLLISIPQIMTAQEVVDYEEMVKSNWDLNHFNSRYFRDNVKGTQLLFPEFALGRFITSDGQKSEVLFFNYDTISKKLFTRKADRQSVTNETYSISLDSLIVFETTSTSQKEYIRLMPEAFDTDRPYPTIYQVLTTGKYSLIKETVKAFVKSKKAFSVYDQSHSDSDVYKPVDKYYLKSSEGKYQAIKLSKRNILAVMSPGDQEAVLKLVKQNGLKWKGEPEIVQILQGLTTG